MNALIIIGLVLINSAGQSLASQGDGNVYYQRCISNCASDKCTKDGKHFTSDHQQPVHLQVLFWDCKSECKYECMWKTVDQFEERGWKMPQFYGKWPFVRILGIQEPASALFSLFNLLAHWKHYRKFKETVRHDSPMYYIWTIFSWVCIVGWSCSTIFHSRDVEITEFLDYACAFAIVLVTCYCVLMRLIRGAPAFIRLFVSVLFLSFFLNHTAYLYLGAFDYGYNMKLNIVIGGGTVILAFAWSLYRRFQMPHVWKCAVFFVALSTGMILEVFDFPPIFNTFDSHALWHLYTAPITFLIYSFIIDDCKYLRNQKVESSKTHIKI